MSQDKTSPKKNLARSAWTAVNIQVAEPINVQEEVSESGDDSIKQQTASVHLNDD